MSAYGQAQSFGGGLWQPWVSTPTGSEISSESSPCLDIEVADTVCQQVPDMIIATKDCQPKKIAVITYQL